MDSSFRIPGTTAPELVVRSSMFGNPKVFADGIPIKRSGRRGLSYQIPLPDGTTTELQLAGQFTGLRATVNGVELPLERRLARWEIVLAFLPVVIIGLGGLAGALFAIGGTAVNAGLVRLQIRAPLKALAMLGVTALAIGAYFATAIAVSPLATLATGTCVNGIREGATVTAATTRTLDCASAHDNEVVGTVIHPDGSFPGLAALSDSGETPCLDAFRAYVGVDFQASTLTMIEVTPTDLTWLKGDRVISCVVGAADGAKMTGSVKGTAR